MAIHIGALLERPPGPKYQGALRFAELSFRPPLPKPKTLANFRASVGDDFIVSLVAPYTTFASEKGPLRYDRNLAQNQQWLVDAADALEAKAIVVPTPSAVTPGKRDRERLVEYFSRLKGGEGDPMRVWGAGGLWEVEDAARFAPQLGAVVAVDPLQQDIPVGPVAYTRLRAVGARAQFSEGLLFDIAESLLMASRAGADELFVTFDSNQSFNEASRFAAMVG